MILWSFLILGHFYLFCSPVCDFGGNGDSGGNGNSDGNVDSSISGNSVEFSNSCECGASGESGSSVDSDKSFNLFNRQKYKFKICGRWNESSIPF